MKGLILAAIISFSAASYLAQELSNSSAELMEGAVNIRSTVEASNDFRQSQLSLLDNIDESSLVKVNDFNQDSFNKLRESKKDKIRQELAQMSEDLENEIMANVESYDTEEEYDNALESKMIEIADMTEDKDAISEAQKIYNKITFN